MTTREKILELVADMEQTDNELTDKLLGLYSVSKRLNYRSLSIGFLIGLGVGMLIILTNI